jgi:hypothetical protein
VATAFQSEPSTSASGGGAHSSRCRDIRRAEELYPATAAAASGRPVCRRSPMPACGRALPAVTGGCPVAKLECQLSGRWVRRRDHLSPTHFPHSRFELAILKAAVRCGGRRRRATRSPRPRSARVPAFALRPWQRRFADWPLALGQHERHYLPGWSSPGFRRNSLRFAAGNR